MSAEADAVCGAGYGAAQPGADQPPQRLPAPGLGHPGRHASTWRSRSCATGTYFPDWLLERRRRAERR